METSKLKRFAQFARRSLMEQVSSKLKLVLSQDSAARRENKKAVEELEMLLVGSGKWEVESGLKDDKSNEYRVTSKKVGSGKWEVGSSEYRVASEKRREQVIEKVAYTWFNRFCAIRFMDVNRYTRINVLSPLPGAFQPEILAEAKMGHIDEDMVPEKNRQMITALLNGTAPSPDPQTEAYRLLIVAVCNYYHNAMPYLFERIADYTELLMPDDLLSGNSILAYTREAMTPDVCKDVEVIGWLYQFYISEKKDEIFEGLKKNKKITPENIPAATQLFTPNWIVRYLVENSLGRLWMLNRPQSKLIERMDYYIREEVGSGEWGVGSKSTSNSTLSTSHLRISSPEEIRLCDPASGSGHMLVYGFDLLYAIYEEEGYDPATIVEHILMKNLYGIEIDSRAGELAAFALTMKALQYDKRFLRRSAGKGKIVEPNICVLQNIKFEDGELVSVGSEKWVVGSEKQKALLHDLYLFEEADNFGSLLRPHMALEDIESLQKTIHSTLSTSHSLFEQATLNKVIIALEQASYLSPKYQVVVANPPYMGGKGMNGRLGAWVKENYPDSKSDLFAMFIERGFDLVPKLGYSAMVTMQSWMFLSSYEKLREKTMKNQTIESLCHMGNMVMGIAFGTSATVWKNSSVPNYRGAFCYVDYNDLVDGNKPGCFPPDNDRNKGASQQKSAMFKEAIAQCVMKN